MILRIQKLTLACMLITLCGHAQKMSRDEAVQTALKNNDRIKSAEYQVEYSRQLKKTETDIGKLSVNLMKGQYNTIQQDNNLTLTQSIPFPTTLASQVKLGKEQVIGSQANLVVTQNNLVYDVKATYEQLLYVEALHKLLISQDSLFTDFARASGVRYKTGEANLLEKTTAESQSLESKNQLRQNEAEIYILQKKLQLLLKAGEAVSTADDFKKRTSASSSVENSPTLRYELQQINISRQATRVERNKFLPDITVGYFNQTLIGFQNTTGAEEFFDKNKRFQGFTVGLSIPLWFAPQVARSKAAFYHEESVRTNAEYMKAAISQEHEQAVRELQKNEASLAYYETSALQNATLILSQARKAYQAGEIGYIEYMQSLKTVIGIRTNYLSALQQYNLSVIKIEHLTGSF